MSNALNVYPRSVATALLRVLYGMEKPTEIEETVAVAAIEGGLEGSRQILVSGGFLVDFFPILRYSPSFVPFQRQFAKWRAGLERLMNTPFACYQAATVSWDNSLDSIFSLNPFSGKAWRRCTPVRRRRGDRQSS